MKLEPFVTVSDPTRGLFDATTLPLKTQVFDLNDKQSAPFFEQLLLANRIAFTGLSDMTSGALALPGWVLLDCYLLPSAIVGFTQKASTLPPELFQALAPRSGDDPIPIAAYTAVPTPKQGEWVGISLFSLATGQRIGLRAKALALRHYGAKVQYGITQFDNASLRVHSSLGHLRLMSVEPPTHTLGLKTFVYRMEVPDTATLDKLAVTDTPFVPKQQLQGQWVRVSDSAALGDLRSKIKADPGRHAIVFPGARPTPQGQEIHVYDLGA